jgi:sugar lactone lactonase YvrE
MSENGRIVQVTPPRAIPGGEVLIEFDGAGASRSGSWNCFMGGSKCHLVGASEHRILAIVPESVSGEVDVGVDKGLDPTSSALLNVGTLLAEDLHPVGNPAFDPNDGALFVTRSGSRGQHYPVSIFRIDVDGEIEGFSGDVTNPSGFAFDQSGQMFVSSRLNGTVYRMAPFREAVAFAQDLGVATGLAFDDEGALFVGDRSGTIYKVDAIGNVSPWATHEPSVSAYHLAFGPDKDLYLTGPTVSSYDSITRFDKSGVAKTFYRGLGRPQGLAFDRAGNLYVAASLRGRRGIVRISPDGLEAELFISGPNIVGLCFGRAGEMVIATTSAVYRLPVDAQGILLA